MHNDAAARNRKQAQDEPELTNLLARLYRAVNTPAGATSVSFRAPFATSP
jgi:hypothetical protein